MVWLPIGSQDFQLLPWVAKLCPVFSESMAGVVSSSSHTLIEAGGGTSFFAGSRQCKVDPDSERMFSNRTSYCECLETFFLYWSTQNYGQTHSSFGGKGASFLDHSLELSLLSAWLSGSFFGAVVEDGATLVPSETQLGSGRASPTALVEGNLHPGTLSNLFT